MSIPTTARPSTWTRSAVPLLVAGALAFVGVTPGAARAGQAAQAQVRTAAAPSDTDIASAQRVRQQFEDLLKRFPPAVGRVLKNDPSLFGNDAYLQPYPGLVAFLAQHPEVKRNPAYFLDNVSSGDDYYRPSEQARMWDDMFTSMAVVLVVGTALAAITWIIRTFLDYRRWHRLAKVQAEAHTKLLDRFTANDELLAYVQSPAGSRFLQSAPIALDEGGTRALAAPFSRILWSIQAGLVLAAAGLGLYWVSSRVDQEATQPLFTLGILALSIGGGFVVSAVVSFLLSKRLGLFDAAAAARTDRESHAG